MSFHAPYKFRLMTVILGADVELVRFKRHVYHSDEAFWTDGLKTPWWWERPLPDKECITPRVKHSPRRPRPTHSLKHDERARLEERGVEAEYKVS